MKKTTIFITAIISLLCISCSEQSPYYIRNTRIDINVNLVSAGIIQVEFVPNKEAFYYFGITELEQDQTEPYDDENQFMEKVLNRAYSNYMDWRYEQNEKGAPYIASFADHTLAYGRTDKYFINLKPDTRYFIYAFIVDPQDQQYKGQLFSTVVTTTVKSEIDAYFDMTIDRDWDFVYPLNSKGEVVSVVPYKVSIIDKNTIMEHFAGDTFDYFHKPAWYFLFNVFTDSTGTDSIKISNPLENSFGVSCRQHDGSDPRIITFQENETYYAAICSADGLYQHESLIIYRFTWEGNDTHIIFGHDKDGVGYHW